MKRDPRVLGQLGEAVARRFLAARGLRIVDQNVRTRYGELDLICQSDQVLVFVEVKTRVVGTAVEPTEAISPRKAARLVRLARAYLQEQGEVEVPWRIDVVAVWLQRDGRVLDVRHIDNAVTDP